MDTCRDDLLFEVDLVEKVGMPGRIIVFGDTAESILTGQNEEDTVVAAAEYGKGRIVAFSHNAYGKQAMDLGGSLPNATFYRNVRNWLVRSEDKKNFRFLVLDEQTKQFDVKTLQNNYDILVCLGSRETISASVLDEYIKHGGALIYATTPWGWIQMNKNKTYDQVPYGQTLLNSGFCYSGDLAKDHGSGFAPELNKAETANIGKCFKGKQTLDSLIDKASFLSKIAELPHKYSSKYKPELEKFWKSAEEKVVKLFPTGKIKCKNPNHRKTVDLWQFIAELQTNQHFKAPCISVFPGDFPTLPKLSCKSVKYSSDKDTFFFTGCYAAAGTATTLEVTAINGFWNIHVGAHTDYLPGFEINRWPKLFKKVLVKAKGKFDISSYFGGSIVFVSPNGVGNIEAKLSNVVASPHYDSQDESLKKSWKENRNLPGLWADISGKYMTVTMPSSSIRNLDDPSLAMDLYDTLLKHYHDLRGTDIDKARKMWIVTDEQPVAGYMHAGYPIVTHMDVADPKKDSFLLNDKGFKTKAFWGIFHEIGHNMQQSEWTFDGTGEVTVNIFTLYAMKQIGNIETWIHPWLSNQIQAGVNYLNKDADFNVWKREAGMALIIYAQLVNCFDWSTYKRVFRRYQKLSGPEKPKNNQEKMDLWFILFSEETKYNLAPLAAFWGIPLSAEGLKKLNDLKLTYFLPSDDVTEKAKGRVDKMSGEFHNLSRGGKMVK